MLSHLNGLLDQVVQIFGDFRGEPILLENAKNLRAGHRLDLGNALTITKANADLRRGEALLCHLAALLSDLGRIGLEPRRRAALVG